MIGAGRYGTIVVSARYDRYPIPYYSSYLPPYFYNGAAAWKAAAKALSADSVSLDRVYFLENIHEQYFEFSSPQGKILMNAHGLGIESPESVLIRKGKKVIPGPKTMAAIADNWMQKKKDVE